MGNAHNCHHNTLSINAVNDSVVAHADTPVISFALKLL
jgi:hypothetical protein